MIILIASNITAKFIVWKKVDDKKLYIRLSFAEKHFNTANDFENTL